VVAVLCDDSTRFSRTAGRLLAARPAPVRIETDGADQALRRLSVISLGLLRSLSHRLFTKPSTVGAVTAADVGFAVQQEGSEVAERGIAVQRITIGRFPSNSQPGSCTDPRDRALGDDDQLPAEFSNPIVGWQQVGNLLQTHEAAEVTDEDEHRRPTVSDGA
jgi:hypothetical protein